MPAGIKLFVDGVTESQTGLNDIPYLGTTDAPATWGFPTDIFNIMEIAVNPKAVNWLVGLEKNEKKDYTNCCYPG